MKRGFERSGEKWDEDRRFLDLDLLAVDQSGFNLELKVGSECWNTFGEMGVYILGWRKMEDRRRFALKSILFVFICGN